MLPSNPKIFHGRELELDHIMKILGQKSPKMAILGGGGMGKTSLARAVLHHSDTCDKFEHRYFVSAESATNSIELAALIGLHAGLNPGQDLTKTLVQYFSRKPCCLLILDNLETVWEPLHSRNGVEEFLSLLTEIEHLALIITMRGAERPAKVRWTHPFLLPLKPLSDSAAQQTFMDITDNSYAIEDAKQVLSFTDNMPLAVDLIAHLVDYEGLSNVLNRWEAEKTSLLSMGYDRKSNLDASITLSLSSPRITLGSKELLGLLATLPDGLTDVELLQSCLPIPNILGCKATLLATSLAYQDGKKRLRCLMPIREHVQQFLPSHPTLIQSLRKHFYSLLELYQKYDGEQLQTIINRITMNLGNLEGILRQELYSSNPNLADTIYCTLSLNTFYRISGRGHTLLMDSIQPILPQPCNPILETTFFTEVLLSYGRYPTSVPEQLMVQAIPHFQYVKDPLLECESTASLESLPELSIIIAKFYFAAGAHFFYYESASPRALQFYQKALELSKLCGDSSQQCDVLIGIALLKCRAGAHAAAQIHANEAQELSKLSVNLYQKAKALWVGAECSRYLGNYQASMVQFQRAREIIAIGGFSGGSLDHNIVFQQAEIHLAKTEYAAARSIYCEIVETTSPDQNADFYANALLNIAQIDITIGQAAEDVYQNLNTARGVLSDRNNQIGTALCDMIQADIELREQKFDLAKIKFLEYVHSAWGTHNEVESCCLERLANIKIWHPVELQSTWPVIYLGYAHKSKERLALSKALLFMGDVFIANQDEETATSLCLVALEEFTLMDVHCSRAQCMQRLGDLANKQGHISDAISFWKAARPLFEQSLQAKNVAQIDSRLFIGENAYQKALTELEALYAPQSLPQLLTPKQEISKVEQVVQINS